MSVIEAPAPSKTEVTTRDVLHRAADLLEEFGWLGGKESTQYAKTEEGRLCDPRDRSAARFCMIGAIRRAFSDFGRPELSDLLDYHRFSYRHVGESSTWNDHRGRTKAEVVALLRAAAEAAE